jgi:hypothetical protein
MRDSPCRVSVAVCARGLRDDAFVRGLPVDAFVRGLLVSAFVRDQVGGALSYAAVPRGGLGPPTPPLCRYAECTADLILQGWRMHQRYRDGVLAAWRVFHHCSTAATSLARLTRMRINTTRCPGAWFGRRSGIKEESAALGRHGGQPRSRPSQAPGRTVPPPGHTNTLVFSHDLLAPIGF